MTINIRAKSCAESVCNRGFGGVHACLRAELGTNGDGDCANGGDDDDDATGGAGKDGDGAAVNNDTGSAATCANCSDTVDDVRMLNFKSADAIASSARLQLLGIMICTTRDKIADSAVSTSVSGVMWPRKLPAKRPYVQNPTSAVQ